MLDAGGISPLVTLDMDDEYLTPDEARLIGVRLIEAAASPTATAPSDAPRRWPVTMRGTYVRRQLDHWCTFPGPGDPATAARRHLALHLRPGLRAPVVAMVRAADTTRACTRDRRTLPRTRRASSSSTTRAWCCHAAPRSRSPPARLAGPPMMSPPPSWSAAADADTPAGALMPLKPVLGERIIIGRRAPTEAVYRITFTSIAGHIRLEREA